MTIIWEVKIGGCKGVLEMKLEVEILLNDKKTKKKCSPALNIKDTETGEEMSVTLPESPVEVSKSASERMKEIIESRYDNLEDLKKMFD